jgi:glutathione S-transferase
MNAPAKPITLYGGPLSGHSHRVELLLNFLELPYETVDVPAAARKQADFLAKNPFGQIPAIDDNGLVLADSNAILVYLATRYDPQRTWLPSDPVAAARVQRWLSVAAGELAYGPATARLVTVFKAPLDHARAKEVAVRVLGQLEQHLAGVPFLAGDHPTVADVACYSYIAHAPEGGVPLDAYPKIRAWLARIEALPRFKGMKRSPVGPAAA